MRMIQESVFGGDPCLIRRVGKHPERSGILLEMVMSDGEITAVVVQPSAYGSKAKRYSPRSILRMDGSPILPKKPRGK
jgi:hypothetical protein